MLDISERCIQLMLKDDATIERWSDGSLVYQTKISGGYWKIFYTPEGGWIHIYAPLMRLQNQFSTGFLHVLLQKNRRPSVTRFSATEEMLCLRADYPEEGFQDNEFQLLHACVLEELTQCIGELKLSPIQGDGGGS